MYKIGDRVIAVEGVGDKEAIDVPGTIINIDSDGDYLVEFDRYILGHDGTPWGKIKGKEGYCWWCRPREVSKLEETHETVIKPTEVNCGMGLYLKISDKEVEVKTTDGRKGVAKCHPDDEFDILEGLRVAVDRAIHCVLLTDDEKSFLRKIESMGCVSVERSRFNDVEKIIGYNSNNTEVTCVLLYNKQGLISLKYDTKYSISDLLKERD